MYFTQYFIRMYTEIHEFTAYISDIIEKDIDSNSLKAIISFLLNQRDSSVFLYVYQKFQYHDVFKKFHRFYLSRKDYMKENVQCGICLEIKTVIPFDCFLHKYCIMCYMNMGHLCGECRYFKNPNEIIMFE